MTWQPIESAPKDNGTEHVLLFGDGSGFMLCTYIGSWNGKFWIQAFDHHDRQTFPTHWMPLPDPPEHS